MTIFKVKELINYERIKDVIDISQDLNTEESSKNLVEKYIISDDMKDHLVELAKDLEKPIHKSIQIIGTYGSGKSHLLAFITAILNNNSLSKYITDDTVRKVFLENIRRKFAIVQFELSPSTATLPEFFYGYIVEQLKEKYGIVLDIDDSKANSFRDHREVIKSIINKIKEKDPTMCLVVIIDEISDFLKTKISKEEKMIQTQFLRILGQASQSMDFMFIGAMQENIFTNSDYIDDAEAIGRVMERFNIVTITNENNKKVISKRVLNKNLSQRENIEENLEEYAKKIPIIRSKMEEFIDLYPMHPYVMDVFSNLPYFEKRGIIKFTGEQVEKILEKTFDSFITFDKIYDEMEAKHTIRNNPDVFNVVEAIRTLKSKLDLLSENEVIEAEKIIKALAVLKIQSKTHHNGATAEELSNHLLIFNKLMKGSDRIQLVIEKLRKVTDGQFINRTENGYYYLDLKNDVDYDVVIENKSSNLRAGIKDEQLLNILYSELFATDIKNQNFQNLDRIFEDYCIWNDKKSYRKGSFIYDDGSSAVKKGKDDFNFVIVSPFVRESKLSEDKNTAIIRIKYSDELDGLLKKISATVLLETQEKYQKNVMINKRKEYIKKVKRILMDNLLDNEISFGTYSKNAKSILNSNPDNLYAYYTEIKSNIFQETFSDKYKDYPKFTHQLSNQNIKNQLEALIKFVSKNGINSNLSQIDKGYLRSLDVIDISGNINTENSIYTSTIINILKDKAGQNVSVDEIIKILSNTGFGLQNEIIYLLLVVLTSISEINMKQRGGIEVTASELEEVFKNGFKAFENIPYIMLEDTIPYQKIWKLFSIFEINAGLMNNKKTVNEGLQKFKDIIMDYKRKHSEIKSQLEIIRDNSNMFPDRSIIMEYQSEMNRLSLGELGKINTLIQMKNILPNSDEDYEVLKSNINKLKLIYEFVKDYNEYLKKDYNYMYEVFYIINDYDAFFNTKDIEYLKILKNEIENTVKDFSKIIEFQERRIVKGKLQQYLDKYKTIYIASHESNVGDKINWDKIESITISKEYKNLLRLKNIKCINSSKLMNIDKKIQKILSVKCNKLKDKDLFDNEVCPYCNFPKNLDYENFKISTSIDDIYNDIIDLYREWEEIILREINHFKDNFQYLDIKEKMEIEKILELNKLPDLMEQKTINSLDKLFTNIEETSLTSDKIEEILFCDSETLTYTEFLEKLENLKRFVTYDKDKENLRIKKGIK